MTTNVGEAVVELDELDGDDAADKLYNEAVKNGDIDDVDFGFLFCSPSFDLEAVVGRLGYLVEEDGGELVGGTTAGEISSQGANVESAVFLAISSDDIEFQVGVSEDIWDSTIEKGKIAAIRATKNDFFTTDKNRALLALPAGFTSDRPAVEFKILKGIAKESGSDIPVAGGSTADNMLLEENYQFHNKEVMSQNCVITAVRTDLDILTGQEHGLTEKVETGMITKTNENVLQEISGQPAAEWYADAVGSTVEELKETFETDAGTELQNIFMEALEMTLGEELGSDQIRAITPVQVTEDKGIYTTVEPSENNVIHVVRGDKDDIVNAAKDSFSEVGKFNPVISIVSDCAIRSAGMELDEMQEEIERLAERIECPLAGFYGYGEIGGKESYCTFNNQTVSGFLIAEKE